MDIIQHPYFFSEYANGNVDVSVTIRKKYNVLQRIGRHLQIISRECLEQTDVDKYQMEDITDVLYDEKGNILVTKMEKNFRELAILSKKIIILQI